MKINYLLAFIFFVGGASFLVSCHDADLEASENVAVTPLYEGTVPTSQA